MPIRPVYVVTSCFWQVIDHWQTLIAGGFALVAGLLAYAIGWQQVAAVNRQNNYLKTAEERDRARSVLGAGRILDGSLKIVDESIPMRASLGSQGGAIGMAQANQIRQSIYLPPKYEVIEQLQRLGREIIDNYFQLCVEIEKFRVPGASATVDSLGCELDALRATVHHIRNEVAAESERVLGVLANGH